MCSLFHSDLLYKTCTGEEKSLKSIQELLKENASQLVNEEKVRAHLC